VKPERWRRRRRRRRRRRLIIHTTLIFLWLLHRLLGGTTKNCYKYLE
jgi:hypothetical protein